MSQLTRVSGLCVPILQQISLDRLQKAVSGLQARAVVQITLASTEALSATVQNGEGKLYAVTLRPEGTVCSCPDAVHRKSVCKHAAMVALFLLRTGGSVASVFRVTIGNRVRCVGKSQRCGKVVCVSGDLVSVWWDSGGIGPVSVGEVELLPVG